VNDLLFKIYLVRSLGCTHKHFMIHKTMPFTQITLVLPAFFQLVNLLLLLLDVGYGVSWMGSDSEKNYQQSI
jgi:hypothetical protein